MNSTILVLLVLLLLALLAQERRRAMKAEATVIRQRLALAAVYRTLDEMTEANERMRKNRTVQLFTLAGPPATICEN